MSLQKLDIFNVRNIRQASLQPSPGLNLIYGANTSGKSSVLEAIFILGRARSFRTTHIKQVVNFDRNDLIVSGKVLQQGGRSSCQLGVQFDGKVSEIRIQQLPNQPRHLLAYALPIQLIEPKSYRLLDTGPQIRREFIDWGTFNENEQFLLAWRQYKTALNQRNALIKQKQTHSIQVWNNELVNYGTIVDQYRRAYLQRLEPVFQEFVSRFLGTETVQFDYLSGWDSGKGFRQSLDDDLDRDLRYKVTHSGPHRADLIVSVNNRLAKDFVSRGQLKLLVLCLKLAQVQLLSTHQSNNVCVLIDDFTAELDTTKRALLIEYLQAMDVQVFMTATELSEYGDLSKLKNYKMFHVEHGEIKQA
ncbi:DNA replication/repair protein RecF [Methylotuvimicrobium alcaliphilum]|uniref:DNA replication and repair protein RecF n=1 Tax=Methylotuvimicrobium alcaliphilum (strain DSM 19304 / NCIMB 14124 / VKM B-2133 / 20Z) TaxID=1091494 RepID=G4STN5_META2|nr:DNA replication/repair protein RecF [Methylotuvimicrobium alcaliphilum]CCE21707.1 DNA replication and repair protein recF [Methylotuvimicrobium alcaliphilum 20Z]